MRWRLAPQLGPSAYQRVRDNSVWRDHEARALVTGAIAAWTKPETVLDPACGDASIVRALRGLHPLRSVHLSDISAPQMEELQQDPWPEASYLTGDALSIVNALDTFDLIILTEILEHLDDPESLLLAARRHASTLVASSPLGEHDFHSHEHVWGWDREGYQEMLESTGWTPTSYMELDFTDPIYYYDFQVWVCR